MMRDARVRELLEGAASPDGPVRIKGWVRTRRDSRRGFSFLQVHDGSCLPALQVVADATLANYASEVLHLTTGCAVAVSGRVAESPGRRQSRELQAESVEVVGWVDDPETYPVAAKRHTFEHLREVAHLRPRTSTFGAIARVRHVISGAVHEYLTGQGFVWINTPLITASDCEGAGELFRVTTLDPRDPPRDGSGEVDFGRDFFGREAFLTVSGQLNVECYCHALSRVYTFGPTFRAENSNTSRHLAEFWMIEPELAFAELSDNVDLAESFLKAIIGAVLEQCPQEMAFFDERVEKGIIGKLEGVAASRFERIDYRGAIDILARARQRFEFPVRWGSDLQSEHERYLTEKHFGGPVVVTDWPKDIKAFYMRLNDDGETVGAMDVLVPGMGEIIGGSAREERLEVLDRSLEEKGLGEELWWYRDLRRYGSVPHVGFGLGLERAISYITGMSNVRDAIPFPRTPRNASF